MKVLKGVDTDKSLDVIKKKMSEMEPLEVCVIVDGSRYNGEIVMRSASTDNFEVFSLSRAGDDHCWENEAPEHYTVVPYEGDSITLKLM